MEGGGGGGGVGGGEGLAFFDKWMSGDEAEISRSMKGERGKRKSINPSWGGFQDGGSRRGRQRQKKGEGRWRRRGKKRKIAFRLCSVKGEITHLRRFFQATTASIDQAAGFMSQFPT